MASDTRVLSQQASSLSRSLQASWHEKSASPSNSLLMPVPDSISNDCRDYITWNSVTAQSVVDAGSAAVRPDTVSSKQHMPVRLANGSSSEVFWLSWELRSSPRKQYTPSAN